MASALCLTGPCVHAASEILYNLSPNYKNIDACTSFDHLVCDGFSARHDIPSGDYSVSTLDSMNDNGLVTLRHILESSYPSESQHSAFSSHNLIEVAASADQADQENFHMMQQTYNACMNETALEQAGVRPLVSLIGRIAESFPVEEQAYGNESLVKEEDFANLSDTILLLQRLGVTTFEDLDVVSYNETMVIAASSAGTTPSLKDYDDADAVSKYEAMLKTVFSKLLPSQESRADAGTLAKSVVELEKKMAAIKYYFIPEARQDVVEEGFVTTIHHTPEVPKDLTQYSKIDVVEAGKIGPAIGLDSVIKGLVPYYSVDTMFLESPAFLANVSQIISESNKSTVQSYLLWKAIHAYAEYVDGPEVAPVKRFTENDSVKEDSVTNPRWQTCVSAVDATVEWILSDFYMQTAFPSNAEAFANQIIDDIEEQFMSNLTGLSWMDESVKKSAVSKVENMKRRIGYLNKPPPVMEPKALRAWYTGLTITDSFFNNTMSRAQHLVKRSWFKLGAPVHADRPESIDKHYYEIQAYNAPWRNENVFSAGFLQYPVLERDLPSFVNYGAFATIVGHEISHAFGELGRRFDENGNGTEWWTERTAKEYSKRADCFAEQYSNFSIEGPNGKTVHLNGSFTMEEDIADAGGLDVSFAAWKQRGQSESDKDLPGLDFFSHDQLFFVSYANVLCDKVRKQEAVNRIRDDGHSLSFARILGATANSRAFREAFNCPVKEPTCEL